MKHNEEIIKILEDQGYDQNAISEVMADISTIESDGISVLSGSEDRSRSLSEIDLQSRYDNETDWRKKAALAARIISSSFE